MPKILFVIMFFDWGKFIDENTRHYFVSGRTKMDGYVKAMAKGITHHHHHH